MERTEAKLSTRRVAADGSTPERWLGVLHGIYGAGRNWGAVARSVTADRPEWGAVLVDLRQHGDSTGFPPPHTLEATAADLDGVEVPGGLAALLGHSFGGKVALLRGRNDPGIRQVWVIDSTPEPRGPAGSAWDMLGILRALPDRFDERDAAVDALEARGVARPVALWLSTNLERRDDGLVWRLDLDDMEALLLDFFRADLWPVVEEPRDGLELHFVRATGSSVLRAEAAERIREAGVSTGRVFLHEVPGGHWLNADNPDAVVDLLTRHLD
jgi:esterase